MRIGLYTDDVVIFANPVKEEVDTPLFLLEGFEEATGLKLNQAKSCVIPIKCNVIQLPEVLQSFRSQKASYREGYTALILRSDTNHSSLRHCQRHTTHTKTKFKKGLNSMLMMIAWQIWKERNVAIFRNKMPQAEDVLSAIIGNLELWCLAGACCLEPPSGEEVGR
ncbi:hypothetical protein D1007_52180 [Hordeum vulgare]|nr:hypothetical protein D1007_52180 [Hordeum vulgare]